MCDFSNLIEKLNDVELFKTLNIEKTYSASEISSCVSEKLNESVSEYLTNYENK